MPIHWHVRPKAYCSLCGRSPELVDAEGRLYCIACVLAGRVNGWFRRVEEKGRAA